MNHLILTISLLLLLNGLCVGQQRKVDQPISEELYKIVDLRASSVQSELKTMRSHDWAGAYLSGDHHPTMFMLSPQKGFVVTSSLHTFSPSWVNFGKVSYANSLLTIYPELTKDNESSHVMPTEYAVIKWGDFRYLVPPSDLINFAYDVHSGSESALVDYFTRQPEFEVSRKGLPELPKEYLKYLRMKPIFTKVLSVKEVGNYSADSIVIDAGRDKGVIKGMSFFLIAGNSNYVTLRVTDVAEDRSECHIASIGGGSDLPENYWVRTGWRFSSRIPKNYAGG